MCLCAKTSKFWRITKGYWTVKRLLTNILTIEVLSESLGFYYSLWIYCYLLRLL